LLRNVQNSARQFHGEVVPHSVSRGNSQPFPAPSSKKRSRTGD
jgi:hypothetical protein